MYPRVTNLQTNLVVAVYQTVGGAPKPIGVTKFVTTLTSHVETKFQGMLIPGFVIIMRMGVVTTLSVFVPIVMVIVQTVQIVTNILLCAGGVPQMVCVIKLVTTLTSNVEMKSQGIMMEVVTTRVEYFVLGPIVKVMVQTIQIQLRHAT